MVDFHKGLRDKYGPVYKLRTPGSGGKDLIFVSSPDDIRTVLTQV